MKRPATPARLAAAAALLVVTAVADGDGSSSAQALIRPAARRAAAYFNVDVSRAAGPQAEIRIAADPSSPTHLLAASNSDDDPGMRVYESLDSGRTWSSDVLPKPPGSAPAPCHADPAPAIDGLGNQYVVYIQSGEDCTQGGEHVMIRLAYREAGKPGWRYWSPSVLPEDPRGSFDDNPWLTADDDPRSRYYGRLYLGWFRSIAEHRLGFQISHSDDQGAHWSAPRTVSDSVVDAGYPSLAVGEGGALYAAWHDFGRGSLFLDRSSDGGETFGRDVRRRLRERDVRNCPNGRPIPAQRLRCIRSDPTVIADIPRNRVFLTYSDVSRNGSEDVFVEAYDRRLRPVKRFPRRIGPIERRPSDQFWPTSALDPATGRLWLCYYSTGVGEARTRATLSCSVSGARALRWSRRIAVANVASDETRAGASEFAYGDYEGLALAHGVAHPMWTDSRDLASRGEEIYTATVPPSAQVDISNAPGAQNEPAIAIDPSNPSVLIASFNSLVAPMSVATSTDGGASWSSQPVPSDRPNGICLGDPGVAIDSRGREYFSFLRDEPCGDSNAATGLFVATRNGSAGDWNVPAVSLAGPLRPEESNDKPAIAADTSPGSPYRDRVYVVWARAIASDVHAIVISHSDDGGASWSPPERVDAGRVDSGYPSVATGPNGEVYVAWHPFEEDRLLIAASFDGGKRFGSPRVIDVKRNRSSCPASWPIPAQARRCVRPDPIVSADTSGGPFRGRVYVTYENQAADRTQDVFVAAFDRSLTPVLGFPAGRRVVIGARARGLRYRADQFWPASAVDATTGTLWACFYDTAGDRSRRRAWFSCTRSTNGGRGWSRIQRAAAVGSNETVRSASPFQYGDYEGLAVSAGVAHPAWTDTRRGRSALREEIFTTSLIAGR
jgi:hypothetical protein